MFARERSNKAFWLGRCSIQLGKSIQINTQYIIHFTVNCTHLVCDPCDYHVTLCNYLPGSFFVVVEEQATFWDSRSAQRHNVMFVVAGKLKVPGYKRMHHAEMDRPHAGMIILLSISTPVACSDVCPCNVGILGVLGHSLPLRPVSAKLFRKHLPLSPSPPRWNHRHRCIFLCISLKDNVFVFVFLSEFLQNIKYLYD